MYLTLMVKLIPDAGQRKALTDTMHRFNEACDFASVIAFRDSVFSKVALQQIVYYDIRREFGLPAQLAIRAISRVVESYRADDTHLHHFREDSAVVYDQRILSFKGIDRVPMNTCSGRIKVPVVMGDYQKQRFERVRGQADLVRKGDDFYLAVVVDVPEERQYTHTEVTGADMGIENVATASTGVNYTGVKVKEVRRKHGELRKNLQSAGTRSAHRHLVKLSGRENRFMRDVNHVISKQLVADARGTSSAIAVEELNGIRKRTTVRKAQRRDRSSWAFGQLRQFIECKAALAGVPFLAVDPRNTSRECPVCHHIDKKNRPARNTFRCIRCGFAGPADCIASLNIRSRAAVNQPIERDVILDHLVPPCSSLPF